jgi:hypothetical protein
MNHHHDIPGTPGFLPSNSTPQAPPSIDDRPYQSSLLARNAVAFPTHQQEPNSNSTAVPVQFSGSWIPFGSLHNHRHLRYPQHNQTNQSTFGSLNPPTDVYPTPNNEPPWSEQAHRLSFYSPPASVPFLPFSPPPPSQTSKKTRGLDWNCPIDGEFFGSTHELA